jgi:cation diffusion facilitator family transporter
MSTEPQSTDAAKHSVALKSVTAAVALTTMKIVVGVLTGSLGILAEAAHSGLDLAAAAMTYWAVRVSGRPPDPEHLYGHGKAENLSALAETALLLVTCAWIVYESIDRLLFHAVHVDANAWSFGVMVVSIGVDISRSRMLAEAAERYNSQALEADALHFRTDIWSSAVVIVGLICVAVADRLPSVAFLASADSVAALLVAFIVAGISLQLGWRTADALLDRAPSGAKERIGRAVLSVPGVIGCHKVRMRYSGPRLFVDIHVTAEGNQSLRQAHDLTEDVERAIVRLYPDADVTVHAEPDTSPPEGGTKGQD